MTLTELVSAMEGIDPQQCEATKRCFLCESPSDGIAVFVPVGKNEKASGKSRALFYGLCEACSTVSDCAQRVENKFFAIIQPTGVIQ